jgi:hypothetical protein
MVGDRGGGHRVRRLRRAGRLLWPGHVHRLPEPRRHGHLAGHDRPAARARPRPVGPSPLVVLGDPSALHRDGCARRRQPPARDRRPAGGRGRRVGLLAVPRVPRRADRPRPVPAGRRTHPLAAAPRSHGRGCRAAGAALRLRALGRVQGGRGRGARRPRRGADRDRPRELSPPAQPHPGRGWCRRARERPDVRGDRLAARPLPRGARRGHSRARPPLHTRGAGDGRTRGRLLGLRPAHFPRLPTHQQLRGAHGPARARRARPSSPLAADLRDLALRRLPIRPAEPARELSADRDHDRRRRRGSRVGAPAPRVGGSCSTSSR